MSPPTRSAATPEDGASERVLSDARRAGGGGGGGGGGWASTVCSTCTGSGSSPSGTPVIAVSMRRDDRVHVAHRPRAAMTPQSASAARDAALIPAPEEPRGATNAATS